MSDLHAAAARVLELHDRPGSINDWSDAIDALRAAAGDAPAADKPETPPRKTKKS